MRKISKLMLLVALAGALLLVVPPATAAPTAEGHVTGTVLTTGNLGENIDCNDPNDPGTDTVPGDGYEFDGVAIEGAFRNSAGNANFLGRIEVFDVAGSAQWCNHDGLTGIGDMGYVNSATAPAKFLGTGVGNITGIFWGDYIRDGAHVEVVLEVWSKINPPSGSGNTYCIKFVNSQPSGGDPTKCEVTTIYVSAEFIPDLITHADGSWDSADFHGSFGVADTRALPNW